MSRFAPRNPRLTGLWLADPKLALEETMDALRSAGTVAGAADRLEIARGTLYRWLQESKTLRARWAEFRRFR